MVCSTCHQDGHNACTCTSSPVSNAPPVRRIKRPVLACPLAYNKECLDEKEEPVGDDEKNPMGRPSNETSNKTEMYDATIQAIISVAESIGVERADGDGRIDSAMKEKPFLAEMKQLLLKDHPDWDIVISPPRAACDIMINSIRINLKLTDCKTADNSANKPSIFYSITGDPNYPYASNWNEFLDRLTEAKSQNGIKTEREKTTEYHYLVKNKRTGEVLLKPIFDIHTYVSNPSNDLQINWKNEFEHREYHTEDADYPKKVHSLLVCIQNSVREMIERTRRFAEADMASLI